MVVLPLGLEENSWPFGAARRTENESKVCFRDQRRDGRNVWPRGGCLNPAHGRTAGASTQVLGGCLGWKQEKEIGVGRSFVTQSKIVLSASELKQQQALLYVALCNQLMPILTLQPRRLENYTLAPLRAIPRHTLRIEPRFCHVTLFYLGMPGSNAPSECICSDKYCASKSTC